MSVPQRAAGERGFTLVEVSIVVAILLVLAGSAYETLGQRPAQVRSNAVAFAGLIAEARALASITGDANTDDGSGASIGVVRDGDDYVATLYRYRPIRHAAHEPQPAPNTPPLRLTTALAIGADTGAAAAPFALFFSTSGHVSAQSGFVIGTNAPLETEPACPLDSGVVVHFSDPTQTQDHAISCEMAQLDLDPATPATAAVSGLPHRAL